MDNAHLPCSSHCSGCIGSKCSMGYDIEDDMGVRSSVTKQPMDRCRLDPNGDFPDGAEDYDGPDMFATRWFMYVNLWCPRSSLGRRSCKRSGCRIELQMLEEMEK